MSSSHARFRQPRYLCTLALLCLGGCAGPTAAREDVLVLEVAPARVPCVGSLPKSCLQVRERSDSPWQLFYGEIDGFTHEAGYEYTVRVAVRVVPNPPADGSGVAYRLLSILTKTPG
jgi:hypothetical protein